MRRISPRRIFLRCRALREAPASRPGQLPLQKLLDSQVPAIVLVSDKGYKHFVVIKGVSGARVLIGDPSSGTRMLTQAAFEAIWSNRLLFVIHGSNAAPAVNSAADWRAAPGAPLGEGINRSSLAAVTACKGCWALNAKCRSMATWSRAPACS
ncbi:cysteine peptidase family C39 domain-containing protein [Massilia polaris]|nr:cysteine peptidase family C39 domain-containing protein [Massilia polaris]